MAITVYPRVCGGTGDDDGNAAVVAGLSPRVRGNLGIAAVAVVFLGSIPACAGEPGAPGGSGLCCPVYPRVCGGTNRSGTAPLRLLGLSPCVRGNRGRGHLPEPLGGSIPACAGEPQGHERGRTRGRDGSIPACAGEPMERSRPSSMMPVYPRVCGGTFPLGGRLFSLFGLSPRVRGNRFDGSRENNHRGSIPACAGEPSP